MESRKSDEVSLKLYTLWVPPFVSALVMFPPFGLLLLVPQYLLILMPVVSSCFLFVFLVKVVGRRPQLPGRSILVPVAVFMALGIVSAGYSESRIQCFKEVVKIAIAAGSFAVLADVLDSGKGMRLLLAVVSSIGFLLSVQGLLTLVAVGLLSYEPIDTIGTLNSDPDGFNYRIVKYDVLGVPGFSSRKEDFVRVFGRDIPRCSSLFIEPGYFANFLELGISASFALYFLTSKRFVVLIAAVIQCIALIFTFSLGGWLAAAIGLGAALVIGMAGIPRRASAAVGLAILLLIPIAVLGRLVFHREIIDLVDQSVFAKIRTDNSLSSGEMRLISLKIGMESFLQRPFLGVGLGQSSKLESPGFALDVKYGANNALVSVLVELGIPGLIVYLWLLLAIFAKIRKLVLTAHRSNSANQMCFACSIAAGMVALVVHSMIVETKWVPFYWLGLTLTYLSAEGRSDLKDRFHLEVPAA